METKDNDCDKYMKYKLKYLKLKQQIGKGTQKLDSPIKVMTWNVCWEALDGARSKKLNKTNCVVNNKNICVENISNLIHEKITQSYDFICLQEIRKVQWEKLQIETPGYNIIYNDVEPAGIVTIIKNKYRVIAQRKGNLINLTIDARPYTILILDNNMILINLHMPHKDKYQIDSLSNLKRQLDILEDKINDKTIFVMCGDFNNSDPKLLPNFRELLPYPFEFYPTEKQINSCCITNWGNYYTESFDHIYSTLKTIKYETINDDTLLLMDIYNSDHLPIFAELI